MEIPQGPKIELRAAKVVLLGDDAAVRSAIIQRLMNNDQLPESLSCPSGKSVTVHSQIYEYEATSTRVDFWNIEDPRVFRDIPHIIFSPHALYVIVYSGQNKKQEKMAWYWSVLIQRFAPDAPVLHVVNDANEKLNIAPSESIFQSPFLQTTEPPHISVWNMTPQQFHQSFTCSVLKEIQSTLWLSSLSKPECRVIAELAEQPDIWTNKWVFEQICQKHDVKSPRLLLNQLHDLGVLFYSQDAEMRERILLRPDWLANALHAILYDDSTHFVSGLLPYPSLREALPNSFDPTGSGASDSGVLPFVLGIMRKYGLSSPYSQEQEFIPARCFHQASSIEEDYENNIDTMEVLLTFDTPPINLLHRLMIRRKKELNLNHVWYSGAMFLQRELGLSAVVSARDNALRLLLLRRNTRHSRHTYITLLRSDVNKICRELNLSKPVCEIIYRESGITAALDYDTLNQKLEDGETTIYAREFRKSIPIQQVLGNPTLQVDPRTKLLADLASAIMDMRDSPRYWDAPDNDRTTHIGQYLLQRGYNVQNQSREGIFTGRTQQEHLELLISRQGHQPWASCETMRITGAHDLRRWNDHLGKLLTNFQTKTCTIRFLISYAECEPHEYSRLWTIFNDHMRDHNPDQGKPSGAYQHILPLAEQPEFLRVAQRSYDIGGTEVTVYHYFVRIGPTTDGSAEQDLRNQIEKNNAFIETLKAQLAHEQNTRVQIEAEIQSFRMELEATIHSSKKQIAQLQQDLAQKDKALNHRHPFTKLFPSNPTPDPPEDDTDDDEPVEKEYRVIIMGDSEAGKSQLLHRLRHPKRNPKAFSGDVTPGIDIASRCYTIGGDRVRVNFWDFGGQEILHSMHRLFLASNTLYVIVLNTRNDNQEEQARFWLHYVALYATGAPVLLVLNKIDQNPDAALNLAALRRSFRHTADIQDVLRLSAREWDREQFENLFLKCLLAHIESNMDESNFFSREELQIRDLLRARHGDQQIMEMSEFRKLCKEGDFPKDYDFNNLAKRFHRAGMFVYFQTRTNMILNPEWITRAIYRILNQGGYHAANGIIDYEAIEDILYDDEDADYGKSQVDFVMKIMRLYGLSFQYRPQGTTTREQEFIPMLCKRQEPIQFEDFLTDDEVIQMQLVFPYLPAGVLYQLVTDLHLDDSQQQWRAKNFQVWISGIAFETNDDLKVAVVRERDRMLFYIRGENRVAAIDYLKTLCYWVESIARGDLYNANVRQRLLGYSISGKTEFFDYDRLTLSKEKDLSYVMSKFKPGPLFVQDVLDQREETPARERDELLRLLLKGATRIQEDKEFWKMDENGRNRELKSAIHEPFITEDQHQGGLSESGAGVGELDILVRNQRHIPIAIVEALNTTSINTINWRKHLDKLMGKYNTSGLSNLILVSYVKCPEEKFSEKYGEALALWRNLSPAGYDDCFRSVDTFLMENCPELVHITRAEYVRNQSAISVYHFMIRIGDHS